MKSNKTLVSILAILLILSLVITGCGTQQAAKEPKDQPKTDFPTKPITLIVPFAAGGVSDIIARQFSEAAKNYLPQPVNVVNRPGGSATVGTNEVVTSNPDGYTLLYGSSGELSSGLHAVDAPYGLDSYTPLGQIGVLQAVLAVKADAPWKDLKEFIEYAKNNPEKVSAGIPGEGTVVHLTGQNFAKQAGIKLTTVPFQGSGKLIPGLLGGHVDAGFLNVTEIISQYKAGEVRVLAIFSDQRNDLMKDVPTAKELGINAVGGATHYIVAPNNLPDDVSKILKDTVKSVTSDPKFLEFTNNMGYQVIYNETEECKRYLKEWNAVTKDIYAEFKK